VIFRDDIAAENMRRDPRRSCASRLDCCRPGTRLYVTDSASLGAEQRRIDALDARQESLPSPSSPSRRSSPTMPRDALRSPPLARQGQEIDPADVESGCCTAAMSPRAGGERRSYAPPRRHPRRLQPRGAQPVRMEFWATRSTSWAISTYEPAGTENTALCASGPPRSAGGLARAVWRVCPTR
jgi:hypothetical protein